MDVPRSEVLLAIRWLAGKGSNGEMAMGSGVSVKRGEKQYVVTAAHVVDSCGQNPQVRFENRWNRMSWRQVGRDNRLDIAVLEGRDLPAPLPVRYGSAHIRYGEVGRALGFPLVTDEISYEEMMSSMATTGAWPLPMTAVITAGGTLIGEIMYTTGYINSGFSGGAVAYPIIDEKGSISWTIAGIITHRGALRKNGVDEPTGIFRYTSINAAFRLIDEAEGRQGSIAGG